MTTMYAERADGSSAQVFFHRGYSQWAIAFARSGRSVGAYRYFPTEAAARSALTLWRMV